MGAKGEFADTVREVNGLQDLEPLLLLQRKPQELGSQVPADADVECGRHLPHMQLGLDAATLLLLGPVPRVGLLGTLAEDILCRPLVPAAGAELPPHVLTGGAAVVLVEVALEARVAPQVRRSVARPHAGAAAARCCHLGGGLGHVQQTVAQLAAERAARRRQPRLVDLMHHVHDVRALGVQEVHVEHSARSLRERHVNGDVQVLLVLVLVDEHFILGVKLQEVPELGDEEGKDQAERADGKVASARGLHPELLHRPGEGVK
mmetsp:Transcript_71238/g.230676  ORF Transcript_71238/g.230676 Transcript_71238/m.230676 type:complete len:262 (+) Transcript_71238:798-1583(+)